MIPFKQFFKPTKTIDQISKKHGVSEADLESQLKKGIAVEFEHTNHDEIATTIALHHIEEDPHYYDKLEKFEESINEAKRTPERSKQLIDRLQKMKKYQRPDYPARYFGKSDELRSQIKPLVKSSQGTGNEIYGSNVSKSYEEKDVPLHKIYTAQDSVSSNQVKSKIDEHGKGSPPKLFYHQKSDTYHILDGNHRVAAAAALGEPTISAHVYKE